MQEQEKGVGIEEQNGKPLIGYNEETGKLTYNHDFDESGFTEQQQEFAHRYKTVTENNDDITLHMVDQSVVDELTEYNGTGERAIGVAIEQRVEGSYNSSGAMVVTKRYIDVYVSVNPTRTVTTTSMTGFEGQTSTTTTEEFFPEGTSGYTGLHEMDHAYEYSQDPIRGGIGGQRHQNWKSDRHNGKVESFMNRMKPIYRHKGKLLNQPTIPHQRRAPPIQRKGRR